MSKTTDSDQRPAPPPTTVSHSRVQTAAGALPKAATGIAGLDEITGGGLPAGRPSLVCGSAGCGKTLLAMHFLVHGATRCGEPGVFLAFEENADELSANVRSLGFDLDALAKQHLLTVDTVHIEPGEIQESGDYDLEGLFIRLGFAIDAIGARRVVLDTLEALFGGLTNQAILRAELRRLFRWLKDRGVTAIITAERGDGALTRFGIEEYVSDCVILLDNRVVDQIATRRLRIVKYRGSAHGTNEYPFLIDSEGLEVLPITAAGLDYKVSRERISSGVPDLDAMLGGGFYRGSSVLISGVAGSGKSSLASSFVAAACKRGEKCLYFSFEESHDQVVRNMASIGLDMETPLREGLLRFHAARPTLHGLESHLAVIHRAVRDTDAQMVVIDSIGTFLSTSSANDVRSLLVRLLDFLKERRVTALYTSLTTPHRNEQESVVGVSSLIDSWLVLSDVEAGGERNRTLSLFKSRGMGHSRQTRELLLTDHGIRLSEVFVGPAGILVGSARTAEQARQDKEMADWQLEVQRRRREVELKREDVENRIALLRHEFKVEEERLEALLAGEQRRREDDARLRQDMAQKRQTEGAGGRSPARKERL